LIVAVLLDPEGGITGGAASLVVLPWSIFTLQFVTGRTATVALHFVSGLINVAIMYVVIKYLLRTASLQRSLVTVLASATIITTVVWTLNGQIRDNRIRIVNDRQGTGVWMAIDDAGLKALAETPGVDSAAPDELRSHLLFVPNKTRGNYKGRRFLMADGRLVVPFPTNEMDNPQRVEVEKIKIIDGQNKGVKGWVLSRHLKRLLTMFAV